MPAGSIAKMNLALDYGADAVYLGPPIYSLRARDNEFQKEKLRGSINDVHAKNKKAYVTLNIFARNRKLKSFSEDVVDYAAMKPDAFIISDPGLGAIARELAPEIPIHLSVQANCMNWKSVQFWKKSLEIERVILSRELSIQEISEIKQRVPDMELEAFVHGSICIAYSGRCLISSYVNYRDANQGVCDNSCRNKYKVSPTELYLENVEDNPGELYKLDEDEHGTYLLNSKDLCMIEHLDKLVNAGVISFKVEGRTKSEFYSAMVARAYRGALNDLMAGRPFNPYWRGEINKLTSRGFHTAFMLGDPGSDGQNYETSTSYNDSVKLIGLVKGVSKSGVPMVEIKHKVAVGDRIKVLTPDGNEIDDVVDKILSITGVDKTEVHSGAGVFQMTLTVAKELPERSLLMTHQSTV